jgi:hypothetical protein
VGAASDLKEIVPTTAIQLVDAARLPVGIAIEHIIGRRPGEGVVAGRQQKSSHF